LFAACSRTARDDGLVRIGRTARAIVTTFVAALLIGACTAHAAPLHVQQQTAAVRTAVAHRT